MNNIIVNGASYIGRPQSNTVMYISKKVEKLLENLNGIHSCVIFAENGIHVDDVIAANNSFIFTDTPQRDYAEYVTKLAEEKSVQEKNRKTSIVNDSLIGENVRIGENTYIEPGCFIGHDVVIGSNSVIKTGTIIKNAVIGDNFIACENCTIGTNGFTMAEDDAGNKIRIPTLGKVIIGNNVEISALTNISCGSAGDTVIKDNVKIDSLVHIGHDVQIGNNVEIPAGAIVGGFVELGDKAYVGINATLRNRIKIGANAFVGMGAVVTKSVEENVTVVGNPAKPFERK